MNSIFARLSLNRNKILILVFVELLVILQGIYCFVAISPSRSTLVFTAVSVMLIGVLTFIFFREENEKKTRRVFLIGISILACTFLVIFPPNSAPDEVFHFQASYKYSDMILGEEVSSNSITIRNEDKPLFEDNRTKVSATHYREVLDKSTLFSDESGYTTAEVVSSFGIADNPPQTKIASALGITIGKLMGLGAYPVYYLGRLFNFLSFIILIYFSVKATPFGKNIFMTIAMLPMTLHLAVSYSYDVATIGIAFLLTACCLKAIYEKGRIDNKLLVGIGVLIFLIAPCKVVYSAIGLLVLFIPKERFASKKICILIKGVFLLLAIASAFAIRASSLVALSGVNATTDSGGYQSLDVRGNQSGTFYNISDVLDDPLGIIILYLKTFGIMGSWYLSTAVGGSLGWFQPEIVANDLIVFSFIIILLVASLKSNDISIAISLPLRITLIGITLVVCILVGASMLLGHTFIGEPYIMGIQGRYVLPVAPLLLFALQNSRVVYNGNPASIVILGSFALNLLYLNYIFASALNM